MNYYQDIQIQQAQAIPELASIDEHLQFRTNYEGGK